MRCRHNDTDEDGNLLDSCSTSLILEEEMETDDVTMSRHEDSQSPLPEENSQSTFDVTMSRHKRLD